MSHSQPPTDSSPSTSGLADSQIPIYEIIATELGASLRQVQSAVELLDEGATVPFVARYRKEATGGLDDIQLRELNERLGYLRELADRRSTVLKSIEEQGKLTDDLKKKILAADTKTRLEDLYLPYKKKRRTRAQKAREAGLEPLALSLLSDPTQEPEELAKDYLNAEHAIEDVDTALAGARQILIEKISESPEIVGEMREFLWEQASLRSSCVEAKKKDATKFRDYFEFSEYMQDIPSHRYLALLRGRELGFLQFHVEVDGEAAADSVAKEVFAGKVRDHLNIEQKGRAADRWLAGCVRLAFKTRVLVHLEGELIVRARELAEEEAIHVFARNLNDLLLAAPAGRIATLGLDPGIRTGVKVAAIDDTGKVVDTATIYPHEPRKDWEGSLRTLSKICDQHKMKIISIGNGTASRETDRLAADLMQRMPQLKMQKIIVNEAGASVYSASELASKELPEMDVSLRGAVSIARRLQDPLAELVKIDPKSIGVGQYQHDVNQSRLAKSLEGVVEDCVNSVGVDVNTASPALLSRVSGLGSSLASNVVKYRDENGAFTNRKQLKKVARLGDKAFQQCAGFLKVSNGDNPLDSTSVHPEAYPVVKKILEQSSSSLEGLLGNRQLLRDLNPQSLTDEVFGLPTVTDIIGELEKPGRDPRGDFECAQFREGVERIQDLEENMSLEGVVTNVTNFGAFVDIGVHRDGLVHISCMADRFVEDPHDIVKTGQVVKVRVVSVEVEAGRISLSMKNS